MSQRSKLTGMYRILTPQPALVSMADSQNMGDQGVSAHHSFYQRLIQGSASRLVRYREYDMIDYDVEISRSLDTIAEEMCGNNTQDDLPCELVFSDHAHKDLKSSTVLAVRSAHKYWCDFIGLDTKIFHIARNVIKYGDCCFLRNHKSKKWEWVPMKNVIGAIVDADDMTHVVGWRIKKDYKAPNSPYNTSPYGGNTAYNTSEDADIATFSKEDVIMFSLNDDMSESAPFGESVLRPIYKAQKQKELIEDAVLIYRISRAPERRVFLVEVGKMPPQRVKGYLENLKNDMRQKRTPSHGGGADSVDSVLNPMATNEDIFLASRDGKGTKIETLPGGSSVGVIDDLEYFQWKVFRGLRIPLSYMREGADNAQVTDGSNAYMAELRFALFVNRLQRQLNYTLDVEFKRFLRELGVQVDPSLFTVKLPDPENFGKYRQQKIDADLINNASSAVNIPGMSTQMIQQRYLQWTVAEIKQNERFKLEELGIDPDSPEGQNKRLIYQSAGGDAGGMDMVAGGDWEDPENVGAPVEGASDDAAQTSEPTNDDE